MLETGLSVHKTDFWSGLRQWVEEQGTVKIWEVQLGYLSNTKWWMDGSEREISKEKAPRWVTATMRQKILECCLDFWLQPVRSMAVLFNKIEKLG